MNSSEIRQKFLKFFESKGHTIVPSSSLVPHDDPTLLFTNAGMNQFKDAFLGREDRGYTRATSSQRCVRAGGKHNDLENVGYTARHHTFFEMLGNFSFGDYFKEDAIKYAWEFLTSKEWLGLPTEKLMVTVYASDDEAYDLWAKDMGVPADKIVRIGDNKGAPYASDNFWQMGDTGPCGPCSEIFYDHGDHIWGGPPGSPEEDGDRFIEIWNNVFMQFDRQPDGEMVPLPKPSVDTGMGLERIAAILQGVHSNYEIDLFQHLIKDAAKVTGATDLENKSLRVIADHIRSCAFLISDGVMPSNEGRGYVLRRIIRRAVRHGNKLGCKELFFNKLVASLAEVMGDAYPELNKNRAQIEKVLRLEEEQFASTLDNGMKILEAAIADMKGKEIPGETVFKLYDTYGFPADLTADIARERELTIDEEGFNAAMEQQRANARAAGSFAANYHDNLELTGETEFKGYDALENSGKVVSLFKEGQAVDVLNAGEEGIIVLDQSAFYAESGGQVGDTGLLVANGVQVQVNDTTKEQKNHLHHVKVVEGSVKVGESLTTQVDAEKREQTAIHHSATHLLHAALRNVLGDHVAQKGSLNDDQRIRFDFSHLEAMTVDELKAVEDMVNDQIRLNSLIETDIMNIDAAKEKGAMALFGEKYDDEVRVLTMGGDFSVELCGGTHAKRTGDIGLLKIVSESGIASGVRRVEAVVGKSAMAYVQGLENNLGQVAAKVKAGADNTLEKVDQLVSKNKQLEKELAALKSKLASTAGSDLAGQAKEKGGVKYLAAKLEGADVPALRSTMDQLKNKLGSAVILLATTDGEKVNLAAGVTKDLIKTYKAGDLVNVAAPFVDGRGGGKPDMAMAGGKKPAGIDEAIAAFVAWAEETL